MKMKLQLITLSTLFCLLLTSTYAQNWWGNGVKGEGPIVSQKLDIAPIDGIKLTFSGDVYLKQGSRQEVVVEAQQNIIDIMKTDVKDKTWKIGFEKNVGKTKPIKVYITLPNLTKIHLSGSGNVKTENEFSGLGDVSVSVSGSGDVKAHLEAKTIATSISGSGDVQLRGSANSHEVRISGSGDIASYDLRTGQCDIRISGSGECEVHVKEQLEVSISGSGDVFYKGDPNVRSKIRGSGDIISKG